MPNNNINETYTNSIPLSNILAEHLYLFSIETSPNSKYSNTLRLHLLHIFHLQRVLILTTKAHKHPLRQQPLTVLKK